MKQTIDPISLHGGHSGEFCNHAKDSLEEIIQAYIARGFPVVGITEHIPPVSDQFCYPDEIADGLTAGKLRQRFHRYFQTLDRLQKQYAGQIRILKGMETESWTGYLEHVQELKAIYRPDYIVGSIHHVRDICIDYSRESWEAAAAACGSEEALYLAYFDLQYEMIQALSPFVVGHFDLVRIHDPDYPTALALPAVAGRIDRNLDLIKEKGLVMDFNLRPLARGEAEPYLSRPLLEKIKARGIPVVPGDDSHGVAQAGAHVDRAIDILTTLGFDTNWPLPGTKGEIP